MSQSMKKCIDQTPLTFGKHKGKTPSELLDEYPSYLAWMLKNFENGVPFSPEVIDEVNRIQAKDSLDYDELDNYLGLTYGDTC